MKCSDAGQCGCLVSRLTIPIWKQAGDMQLLSVSQVLMDVSLFQIDNIPTYVLMKSLCSRWGRPNGRRAHGRGENGSLLASHRSPYQASDGWHQPRGEAPGIILSLVLFKACLSDLGAFTHQPTILRSQRTLTHISTCIQTQLLSWASQDFQVFTRPSSLFEILMFSAFFHACPSIAFFRYPLSLPTWGTSTPSGHGPARYPASSRG